MVEEWLSIGDITTQTSLPETTVRRYASLFKVYIKTRSFGRTKKYSPDTIRIMNLIAGLYQSGCNTQEIIEKLNREIPQTVEIETVNTEESFSYGSAMIPPTMFIAMMAAQQETLREIAITLDRVADRDEEIIDLREEVSALRDQLRNQEENRKQDLEERDQQLVSRLKAMLEEKENQKKKSWLDKLLGR